MSRNRIEAFSDGVIAIIIIMVLELKVPPAGSAEPNLYFAAASRGMARSRSA